MTACNALPPAALQHLCAQRVLLAIGSAHIAPHVPPERLAATIAAIVARNLAAGRPSAVRAAECSPQLQAYVDRVVQCYRTEHLRVRPLLSGEEQAWQDLIARLTRRAGRILARLGMSPARAATDAPDFAMDTCEAILRHPFPFDVPFDAWACRILKNTILAACIRKRGLPACDPVQHSLDDPVAEDGDHTWHDEVADATAEAAFERCDTREWLDQAIAALPNGALRLVIVATYWDALPDAEIAACLGRSRQAVYNLRHRALRGLEQMLSGEAAN